MNRWVRAASAAVVVGAAGLLVAGCGQAKDAAEPAASTTPTNIATPAAPGGEATPTTPAPTSSSDADTSVSPTGDPSPSFWTDDKIQQVEPEDMPTEH